MTRGIWLVALVTAVCAFGLMSCYTVREEFVRVAKRISMPSTLQATVAEIDQTKKNIAAAQEGRDAFASGAVAMGIAENKFVKEQIAKADQNIKDGEEYLSRLESWKMSLEAELVQKTVDGEALPEEPAAVVEPQASLEWEVFEGPIARGVSIEIPRITGGTGLIQGFNPLAPMFSDRELAAKLV